MAKSFMAVAAALFVALGGLSATSPAAAQGTTSGPVKKPSGSLCPSGWREGGRGDSNAAMEGYCYPFPGKVSSHSIYARASLNETCAAGYAPEINRSLFCTTRKMASWSAENNLAKDTKLPKPSKGVRCPTGWASTTALDSCYTTLDNPPAARLSKGKACAAGEIEEWGTWCTGDLSGVTRAHAEGHGSGDFNKVYLYLQTTGGAWQGMKCCISPAASAYYASKGEYRTMRINGEDVPVDDNGNPVKGGKQAATFREDGDDAVAANGGESAPNSCARGSSTGAAIGAAIGGDAGARIGSMLGGFGKKKKTGC